MMLELLGPCGCRLHRRRLSLRQCLAVLLLLGLLAVYYTIFRAQGLVRARMRTDLRPSSFCPLEPHSTDPPDDLDYWAESQQVRLLFFSSGGVTTNRELKELLGSVRVKYKQTHAGRNLPDMIRLSKGVGKYVVIVFQDIRDYYLMDTWNRQLLDKYCTQFKVGVLGFLPPRGEEAWANSSISSPSTNTSCPFTVSSAASISSPHTGLHPLLRMLKTNLTLHNQHTEGDWVTFGHLGEGVDPLISAVVEGGQEEAVAVLDSGQEDGIKKVVIGGRSQEVLRLWFFKLLLLDSLDHLSSGRIRLPLTRYLMVDIDDIFTGTARLLQEDVQAMLESQARIARTVTDFRYNLGFSGKTFLQGDPNEDEGDLALVLARSQFWWFPHMWRHLQPHRFNNVTELSHRMELNKQFAKDKGLPMTNRYAVSPHHSGVYPVHSPLYSAWAGVWGISVTSTEEYPNLRPARKRRGFLHQGVSVLPRQTCGLYTKNTHYADYPGGPEKLESSIAGGELFLSMVTNPISIFMSHMPNYCCDRLAPYTFESVTSFVHCHTNIRLRTVAPEDLARTYFKLFPEEKQAVWGNPCDDKRHLEIWSEKKTCDKLPELLVVGPQKTGTTALSTFLQLHPSLQANNPSKETFEEVQFFRGPKYALGLDWYRDFFPRANSSTYLFEKSATYFDGEEVPLRAHRLLPRANIVAVLLPPGERAYSWYQHMRAHNDPTAINHTWREVLVAGPSSPRPLLALQHHCLEPGRYSVHLERWLAHYRPKQLHLVDGVQLRQDPVMVLNQLQHFLQIEPFFDYKDSLVYDRHKGFYCQVVAGRKKCLGKGKGRTYPAMDDYSKDWLQKFYKKPNENLEKLLTKLGYEIPSWLQGELEESVKKLAQEKEVEGEED